LFQQAWMAGFYWNTMRADCEDLVKQCQSCLKHNVARMGFHPLTGLGDMVVRSEGVIVRKYKEMSCPPLPAPTPPPCAMAGFNHFTHTISIPKDSPPSLHPCVWSECVATTSTVGTFGGDALHPPAPPPPIMAIYTPCTAGMCGHIISPLILANVTAIPCCAWRRQLGPHYGKWATPCTATLPPSTTTQHDHASMCAMPWAAHGYVWGVIPSMRATPDMLENQCRHSVATTPCIRWR
jgi:hypothetical protein